MQIVKIFGALGIAVILASCALNAPTATPSNKSGTIRVSFPNNGDVADVPSFMAHELLRAQGYDIQPLYFANPDLNVAALANGESDLSNGSTRTHWAAVQKGADIVTLMEQAGNVWSLVARADIQSCEEFDGKRIGVQSAGSISNALLQAYVKNICPNSTPQTLFVQGSDVRSIAMQKGELDGALLQISDVLQMDKQAPGKFPTFFDYAAKLPQLKINGVYTRRAFARQHPEMVRDYLRALLSVHRSIRQNPQLLYDALIKYLKYDADSAKQVGDTYLAHNIWDVNGEFLPEDAKFSLDFFVEIGSLPPGLDAAKIVDMSYLNAVLDEIGRE